MPIRCEDYHPLFRSHIRPVVMMLDNYSCRGCGLFSFSNHVHHIDGNKQGVDVSKMVTLCPSCHQRCERGFLKFANPNAERKRLHPDILILLQQLWFEKSLS